MPSGAYWSSTTCRCANVPYKRHPRPNQTLTQIPDSNTALAGMVPVCLQMGVAVVFFAESASRPLPSSAAVRNMTFCCILYCEKLAWTRLLSLESRKIPCKYRISIEIFILYISSALYHWSAWIGLWLGLLMSHQYPIITLFCIPWLVKHGCIFCLVAITNE